jgi:hypothetical protein
MHNEQSWPRARRVLLGDAALPPRASRGAPLLTARSLRPGFAPSVGARVAAGAGRAGSHQRTLGAIAQSCPPRGPSAGAVLRLDRQPSRASPASHCAAHVGQNLASAACRTARTHAQREPPSSREGCAVRPSERRAAATRRAQCAAFRAAAVPRGCWRGTRGASHQSRAGSRVLPTPERTDRVVCACTHDRQPSASIESPLRAASAQMSPARHAGRRGRRCACSQTRAHDEPRSHRATPRGSLAARYARGRSAAPASPLPSGARARPRSASCGPPPAAVRPSPSRRQAHASAATTAPARRRATAAARPTAALRRARGAPPRSSHGAIAGPPRAATATSRPRAGRRARGRARRPARAQRGPIDARGGAPTGETPHRESRSSSTEGGASRK